MELTFKLGGSRHMSQYLTSELITLAKLKFAGWIKDDYGNDDIEAQAQRALLSSLERFKLAGYGHLYEENGRWVGWAWGVSEEGEKLLKAWRPKSYGCRCEASIRLPCVCTEKTYCPNPEHKGNGCHGTHD